MQPAQIKFHRTAENQVILGSAGILLTGANFTCRIAQALAFIIANAAHRNVCIAIKVMHPGTGQQNRIPTAKLMHRPGFGADRHRSLADKMQPRPVVILILAKPKPIRGRNLDPAIIKPAQAHTRQQLIDHIMANLVPPADASTSKSIRRHRQRGLGGIRRIFDLGFLRSRHDNIPDD